MPFHRSSLDPSRALVRPATPNDRGAIARVLASVRHFYSNLAVETLDELVGVTPGVVLTAGPSVWGAVVIGHASEQIAWLRALAFADGLPVDAGLAALLPAAHASARAAGMRRLYLASDSSADTWLVPRLSSYGYLHDTYVITYAKSTMDVPASGNSASAIRPAQQADLEALLAIDRACFEPQWGKGASTLAPALGQAPCFAVAELGGRPVGYAFAMDYFGGRQVHLVRIAVLPEQRGHAIGIALLAHVVEFARQRRAEMLTLNTQEYNSRARTLYEWFGFRRTGERQLILHAELV